MKESFQPQQNNKTDFIRRIFDLQVNSTYRTIKKMLAKTRVWNTGEGKLLEVGCGSQPYRRLFSNKNIEYSAIDWEGSEEHFKYKIPDVTYYDGENFPCSDGEYNIVFHTEVVEHVKNLNLFFKECFRVLCKNGEMVFSMPFSARYHYIPYDYWRLTPTSLNLVLQENGFKDIIIIPRSKDVCVAAYKVLSIGYRLFFSKNIFKMLISALFTPIWGFSLLIGQLSLYLKWGSEDDCLGYTIYCRKND